MAQVNLYQFADIQLGNGRTLTLGSRATPKTISLTGNGVIHTGSWLSTAAVTEVLRVGSAAGDDIASFDLVAIRCTVDAKVSWVGTLDSTTDSDTSCIGIEAGTWFFISSDQTTEHGGDPGETRASNTTQTITKIYVDPSASGDIELIALT